MEVLERRDIRHGRSIGLAHWSSHGPGTSTRNSSGSTSVHPPSSGSSYGSAPLEGFVGSGDSAEDPMTFVSVGRIEELDGDIVLPIPAPIMVHPPRLSLEERLGPLVGTLQERLDANERAFLAHHGGLEDGSESERSRRGVGIGDKS